MLSGDNSGLKNITIQGKKETYTDSTTSKEKTKGACGVQVYCSDGVVLDRVTITNSSTANLTVNASTVTAKGYINLSDGTWGDGKYINLGWGSGIADRTKSSLGFAEDCSVEGFSSVWTDVDDLKNAGVSDDKGLEGKFPVTDENARVWNASGSVGEGYIRTATEKVDLRDKGYSLSVNGQTLDDPETSFWSDEDNHPVPDVEFYRVDEDKYRVDDDWYEELENGGYQAVTEGEDGPLKPGTYYVKAYVDGCESYDWGVRYIPVQIRDVNNLADYYFNVGDAYAGPAEAPHAWVDRYCLSTMSWVELDEASYERDNKLYVLKENATRYGSNDPNDYTAVSPASFTAGDKYYIHFIGKGELNGTHLFGDFDVLDANNLENCDARLVDDIWSDSIPEKPSLIVERRDNGATVDPASYTIDGWYEWDDDAEDWKPCEGGKPSGASENCAIKISAVSGHGLVGEKYVYVNILNANDIRNYSYIAGATDKNTSPADVKLSVFRVVNGAKEELTRDADYVVEDKWYTKDEDDNIEESNGNPSVAGHYWLKLSGKEGSTFTGDVYIDITVGDPCAEKGHKLSEYSAEESTCTSQGHDAYWECDECGKIFKDDGGKQEIKNLSEVARPLKEHSYPKDPSTITKQATCTEKGTGLVYCTVCHKEKQVEIPVKGHKFNKGAITWSSDYKSASVKFTCANDPKHTETVTAIIKTEEVIKATCEKPGTHRYTATATSSTGYTLPSEYKTAQDIPALGHAYGPFTVTKSATTYTEGAAEAKCTHTGCTSKLTKTIAKLKSTQTPSEGGEVTIDAARPVTSAGGTYCVGSVVYNAPSTTAQLTGKVVVPDTVTINGAPYAVTAIAADAFANNKTVKSIALPAGITAIAPGTFAGCDKLESVTLSAKTESIGDDAFKGDVALKSVNIPDAVTSIGKSAFEGTALAEVVLPAKTATIGEGAFKGCTALKSAKIAAPLTKLPASLFEGCIALTTVDLPSTLDTIGAAAFAKTGITAIATEAPKALAVTAQPAAPTLVLPAAVKSIEKNAFKGCVELKTVDLASATKIGDYAFKGDTALAKVVAKSASTVDKSAFFGCTALKSADVSKAVTIGSNAFKGTSKLKALTVGSKLKTVGSSALSGAKKFTTLTVTSKKLTKKGVKRSLAGSAVKTVKVKVSKSKGTNKKYIAKYKTYFAKKNSGKKVTVK